MCGWMWPRAVKWGVCAQYVPKLADSLDHLIVVPGPDGFLGAAFGFVLLAVDAPGVDPQQNVDAVASPFSDLRCGHPALSEVETAACRSPGSLTKSFRFVRQGAAS